MINRADGIDRVMNILQQEGHDPPLELARLAKRGVETFSPWFLLRELGAVEATQRRLQTSFPSRRLLPFAHRLDQDDVACFDLDAPVGIPVAVVHEDTVPGWENVAEYPDFREWFRQAVRDFYGSITEPLGPEESL